MRLPCGYPPVALTGRILAPVTADQAARQHAVGRDADAQLAAGRQDSVLDPARDQRVLDLQVADRVDRRGPADGPSPDLGQADMPDVARLHHVGDGTNSVLDRHLRVEARGPVDVDMIDAQPLERVGEEVPYRLGPGVVASPAARRIAQRPELDADQHLVATPAAEGLA